MSYEGDDSISLNNCLSFLTTISSNAVNVLKICARNGNKEYNTCTVELKKQIFSESESEFLNLTGTFSVNNELFKLSIIAALLLV